MTVRQRFFDGAEAEAGSIPFEAVSANQTVALNAFTATTVHQPAVAPKNTIALGKPFNGTFLHVPAVVVPVDALVMFNFLPKFNQTFYGPSIVSGEVTLPAPSASATVLNPSVSTANSISLSLFSGASETFQPSVSSGAVVSPQFLSSSAQIPNPQVEPGAVSVQLNFISSASTVLSPSLSALNDIALNAPSVAGSVSQPSVSTSNSIQASLIAATSAVFEPSIVSAVIEPNFIAATGTVAQPQVSSVAYVSPEFLPGGAIFDLVVVPGPVNISLDALASTVTLPTVVVTPGPVFISPELLGSLASLLSLSVQGETRPVPITPYLVVRWRDDNKEWSREVRIDLGNLGETEVVRQLNQSGIFTTRQYEFVCTENVALSFGAAEEDIEFML